MSLISTARALDDVRFLWRVRAAALVVASEKVLLEDSLEQDYADRILRMPMGEDRLLEALVAANPAIASAVTVNDMSTVSTEGVADQDILYVVATLWPSVARLHLEQVAPAPESPAL